MIHLGGQPTLRKIKDTDDPYVTDNGNYIVDVKWPSGIDDPQKLAASLDMLPGVKAHGLFLGMADQVVVASPKGTTTIGKTDAIPESLYVTPPQAAEVRPASDVISELIEASKTAPPYVQEWIKGPLTKQAAVVDASVTMMNARKRIADAQARGEDPLPPFNRDHLPKTEEEALSELMNRMSLTAAEQATVRRGVDALLAGGLPPMMREPIGGHSSVYPETFRTQMAITDPGLDHVSQTLANPRLLDGNWIHMEIIDRDTDNTAPYGNPGFKSLALVRMLLGNDAPSTAFFGRPNYIASTLSDTVPGMSTVEAAMKFNLPTAANWMANAARSVLNMGYSEAKFCMDGLTPENVKTLGKAVHAQANLQEGEYISAAFNLNSLLKDFSLVPADAPQISGAPTPHQRGLMLQGAQRAIDEAKEGGFKKVTVDSASMTPPSYPLIEFFSVDNLFKWAHHAHELGLETYGSGGMRDYHFPLLQLAGLDGVGVGFSIHDAPTASAPGKAGRLRTDKVESEVQLRNAAEKAPVGRAATLMRMLDEKKSDGTITPEQEKLRTEVFNFIDTLAQRIDVELDGLKKVRDDANKGATADAQAAAKKVFENGFAMLIQTALADVVHAAQANELLAQGAKLGVNA
jgi:hypothetical protein